MLEDRSIKRLSKKAKKGMRGWPVATMAFYGPNSSRATKAVVGIARSVEIDETRAGREQKRRGLPCEQLPKLEIERHDVAIVTRQHLLRAALVVGERVHRHAVHEDAIGRERLQNSPPAIRPQRLPFGAICCYLMP